MFYTSLNNLRKYDQVASIKFNCLAFLANALILILACVELFVKPLYIYILSEKNENFVASIDKLSIVRIGTICVVELLIVIVCFSMHDRR